MARRWRPEPAKPGARHSNSAARTRSSSTPMQTSQAANLVADARLVNGGQVCLCPDYVSSPRPSDDEFIDKVIARWTANLPTIVDNPQFTATINEKNYNRIVGLIDDAVSLNATKRQVIQPASSYPTPGAARIAPTILTGVKAGMKIEEDEVFGPVLTVYPYHQPVEAINRIAANPR